MSLRSFAISLYHKLTRVSRTFTNILGMNGQTEPEPTTTTESRQPPNHTFQWILLIALSPIIAIIVLLYSLIALPCLLSSRCAGQPEKEKIKPSPVNDGEFIPNSSGLWLYHRSWTPATTPIKGVVFIVHGLGEHVSRPGYLELIRHLTEAGFAVEAVDQAGHGHSTGERNYIEKFDIFVADQIQFIESFDTNTKYSTQTPRFLFGHSLGSLISLHILIKRLKSSTKTNSFKQFSGVILSSPAAVVDPAIATPINLTAARLLSMLAPKLGIDQLDPTLISRSHEAVERYVNDPLIYHGKLKARLAAEALKAQQYLKTESNSLKLLTMPLLLLHGDDDKVCALEGSKFVLSSVGSKTKHLEIFPGARHELFEDPDSQKFFSKITEFVQQQANDNKQ